MAFSQLKSRVLVALIAGPVVILAVYFGRWANLILFLGISVISMVEFFKMSQTKGTFPMVWLSVLAGIGIMLDAYFAAFAHVLPILAGFLVMAGILELWRMEGSRFHNLGVSFLGVGYIGLLLSYFVAIRELPPSLGVPYRQGGIWALTILLCFWIGDSAAYFLGSSLGKHKLASRVSPKKTVEGAVAGFLAMMLVALVSKWWFVPEWTWLDAAIVGGLCGTVGQLSDLVESQFKRDAGVKDSSNLLPGHGGLFDRFDVLFLTSPVIYYFLRYFSSLAR